jgi:hypothetical protein
MTPPTKITYESLQEWVEATVKDADPQSPYWFMHNAANECGLFCFDCGEERRLKLIAENQGKPDVLELLEHLDGGWPLESDGCAHCDTCGQLLDYSLTNWGQRSEFDHFAKHGIENTPEAAYHIAAMLYGNTLTEDQVSKLHFIYHAEHDTSGIRRVSVS